MRSARYAASQHFCGSEVHRASWIRRVGPDYCVDPLEPKVSPRGKMGLLARRTIDRHPVSQAPEAPRRHRRLSSHGPTRCGTSGHYSMHKALCRKTIGDRAEVRVQAVIAGPEGGRNRW